MNGVSDKIAYLKGLKDGMDLKDEKLVKLMNGVIDALSAISDRMDETDEFVDTLADELDEVEDEIDEIEECLDEWCDDCDCDCCCDDDDDDDDWWWDDDDECCCCDDDDDNCLELECPHCHETICFDSDLFVSGEELRCPVCDKVVFEAED